MKLATLANASVVHTRRWVEHFRARGHDVRVFSLEPAWRDGTAAGAPGVVQLPAPPIPGVLRGCGASWRASPRMSWTRTSCPTTGSWAR
jgi:hypothetical protein